MDIYKALDGLVDFDKGVYVILLEAVWLVAKI